MKKMIQISYVMIIFLLLNQFSLFSQEKSIMGCDGLWYKANNANYAGHRPMGIVDTVYFNSGDSVLITSKWDGICHTMGLNNIDWYRNNSHYLYTYGYDSAYYKSFYVKDPGNYNADFMGFMGSSSSMLLLVLIMNTTTGIKESTAMEGIAVFPNPANNQFTLTTHFAESINVTLELIDALGRKNLSQQIKIGSGEVQSTVDISSLKPGIYFLKITANNSVVVKRIIKAID